MTPTVALDAMGGDHGPGVVVPAALSVLEDADRVELVLVGNHDAIVHEFRRRGMTPPAGLSIRHASQQVTMDESPSQALRAKKDSSMRIAIDLVRQGMADACVSAGNTGALMAIARFLLKTLPGVDRPAICSALPSMNGHTHVLDLGANVESTARHLFEFGVMGSVLASAVDSIPRPRVGLLNIGQEEIKGNERVKEAARMLAASDIDYIGFVEGDGLYRGSANVVVCDGFVGNVALKSSEGVAHMIEHFVRREFQRNLFTRAAAWVAGPVLRSSLTRFDPREYNGASFVGLRGIVIKSHGGADVRAFARAIREAGAEVHKNIPERISKHLASMLAKREAG